MVSVIVPNYNHSLFLRQRIDSVLSQTYQNLELIILDDCSNDDSKHVIEEYRLHPKIAHIIFNESNSGSTFKQWKKGLSLAKGDLIWIAESDDWCEHTFLENLVVPFLSDSNVVVSYCSSINVRDNSIEDLGLPTQFLSQVIDGQEYCRLSLLDKIGVTNASAALFRKDFALNVNFNKIQEYKLIGDRLFWFQMVKNGKVNISGKFLNYCRRHGSNVTQKKNREGVGFQEYLDFLMFIKEEPSYNEEVKVHAKAKILDSFIFMENHKSFLDSSVRNKVYDSIKSFLPEFESEYNKMIFKQKLSNGKSFFAQKIKNIIKG